MFNNLILVGLGGGLGAILRYLTNMMTGMCFSKNDFPLSTFFVNAIGSFFIGLIMSSKVIDKNQLVLFIVTGVLGGFTTFSAFSMETIALFRSGKLYLAMINIILNVFISLLFCYWGLMLFKVKV